MNYIGEIKFRIFGLRCARKQSGDTIINRRSLMKTFHQVTLLPFSSPVDGKMISAERGDVDVKQNRN